MITKDMRKSIATVASVMQVLSDSPICQEVESKLFQIEDKLDVLNSKIDYLEEKYIDSTLTADEAIELLSELVDNALKTLEELNDNN